MLLALSYAVLHPSSVVTPALTPGFVGSRARGGMVELSPADREYCRDITLNVLDRTLHDYADTASWASGGSISRSDVEHDGWMRLRSQDNVSMYAERAADLSWVSSMREVAGTTPLQLWRSDGCAARFKTSCTAWRCLILRSSSFELC